MKFLFPEWGVPRTQWGVKLNILKEYSFMSIKNCKIYFYHLFFKRIIIHASIKKCKIYVYHLLGTYIWQITKIQTTYLWTRWHWLWSVLHFKKSSYIAVLFKYTLLQWFAWYLFMYQLWHFLQWKYWIYFTHLINISVVHV